MSFFTNEPNFNEMDFVGLFRNIYSGALWYYNHLDCKIPLVIITNNKQVRGNFVTHWAFMNNWYITVVVHELLSWWEEREESVQSESICMQRCLLYSVTMCSSRKSRPLPPHPLELPFSSIQTLLPCACVYGCSWYLFHLVYRSLWQPNSWHICDVCWGLFEWILSQSKCHTWSLWIPASSHLWNKWFTR